MEKPQRVFFFCSSTQQGKIVHREFFFILVVSNMGEQVAGLLADADEVGTDARVLG